MTKPTASTAHTNGKAAANGGRKSEARSRVTNGQDVLPGVDNRSMRGRRYYDIQTAITTIKHQRDCQGNGSAVRARLGVFNPCEASTANRRQQNCPRRDADIGSIFGPP